MTTKVRYPTQDDHTPLVPVLIPDLDDIRAPADFCIGESGIWFFSRQWEDGHAAPPSEFLDDRNVIRD